MVAMDVQKSGIRLIFSESAFQRGITGLHQKLPFTTPKTFRQVILHFAKPTASLSVFGKVHGIDLRVGIWGCGYCWRG